jgi:hypothetical protein
VKINCPGPERQLILKGSAFMSGNFSATPAIAQKALVGRSRGRNVDSTA